MAFPDAETPDPLEPNGAPGQTGPLRGESRGPASGAKAGLSPTLREANRDANAAGVNFRANAEGKDNRARRMSMRLAGSGMELASFTLIVGAAGYGIDVLRGHTQLYAAAAGALVGFSLGMYRMIALVIREDNQ